MNEYRRPFYTPELARGTNPSVEALAEAADLLADPYVTELAEQGLLTVAMIRPSVQGEISSDAGTDTEAADEIEQRIQGLGMLAKFSVTFDALAVDEFYGHGHAAPMEPYPPVRFSERFANRLEEFSALMTGGPVTVCLLYGPDAVNTWRNQLGHWNIEKVRDPSTIRGQLGVSNYNNLLHGSDSGRSVLRELDVLHRLVLRRIAGATR